MTSVGTAQHRRARRLRLGFARRLGELALGARQRGDATAGARQPHGDGAADAAAGAGDERDLIVQWLVHGVVVAEADRMIHADAARRAENWDSTGLRAGGGRKAASARGEAVAVCTGPRSARPPAGTPVATQESGAAATTCG